jgi:hypothetical protein
MFRRIATLAPLLGLLLAGCNSSNRPATYPVSGTVTMNGQPLEGATVVFVPTEGAVGQQAATGITDAAGKYKLSTYVTDDGANAGEYRIKVSKYDGKKPTKEEQERYISYEEEQKIQFAGDERPTPPAKNLLPPKFGDDSTSGLTYTVTKGSNTFDIKLP